MATAKKKVVRTRRKERKNIEKGQVHISSSFNNSMVTITDTFGNAISWASVEAKSPPPSPRRPRQRPLRRQPWSMVSRAWKFS